jgi:catechol 2,3-dioxygenase-like lactoylglutathione lyase family enzyme
VLENNLIGIQHVGIPTVDIEKSKKWYIEKLGFVNTGNTTIPTPDGNINISFVEKDGLVLEFYQLLGADLEETRKRTHGHVDHFTMDVLDIRSAMKEALDKGAILEKLISPDGPIKNPAYWSKGVEYVFFLGPNNERIEFCQRLDFDPRRRSQNLGGWSHLGIPVSDIAKSIAFYKDLGFSLIMDFSIPTPDGDVKVAMVDMYGFVVEFYQLTGKDLMEVKSRQDGHIDHFAMKVKDVDKAFAELKAAGIQPLSDAPVDLPVDKGVRYFFVRGPQDEKIEFTQTL